MDFMKLLSHKHAKKTTESGLLFFVEEKKIRLKAMLSLSIIWACAALVCIFFAIFALKPQENYMAKSSLLLKIQKELLTGNDAQTIATRSNNNDAFVFVHLNKKFFLTRFPSGNHDEPNRATDNADETKAGMINTKETERVIRKIKTPTNPKTYVDFTIKPVPK